MSHTIEPTPSAYDYPLLIRHLFHTPLAIAPHEEIVSSSIARYSYRTFRARVGQLASLLSGLGVKRGDTVAVMDWDGHRYLESFFAVPMLGAVLHTVNIRLSAEQILYTINHAVDDVVLVNRDFLPLLEQIYPRIERRPRLVLLCDDDELAESALPLAGEYESMMAGADPGFEFEDFDENTRATTFYTTGTTGLPKGVAYSHRQLVIHTLGQMAVMGAAAGHGRFHREDVYMPITPMFHVHAWGFPYVATLMGAKQVYPGRYTPEGLLELFVRERVTFSHCVPTLLHMLLSAPRAERIDFRGWKVVVGGAALPQGLAKRAMDLGIDIFSGYGMSETCPILTVAHLDGERLAGPEEEQLRLRAKTGRPAPLVDLRIVDSDMKDVPHDGLATGEVVVRAPWLTRAYVKDEERSEELWRGGYLHTGDIGHIDERGYLKVTDRLKDVIKSGGEWISSLELEDIVSQLPGVAEAAAIGIPDSKWGERPLVLIVKAPGALLTEEAVKAHVRGFVEAGAMPKWAMPDAIRFVEEIAKTSVGKIDKKLLRQRFGEWSCAPRRAARMSARRRRLLVIANPRSGRGESLAAGDSLRSALASDGWEVDIRVTDRPGHATEIAAREPFSVGDALAAAGGDGTLHEIVNGLMQRADGYRPPLAVVPGGTGNSLAHDLGVLDVRGTAALVREAQPRALDVMSVSVDGRGRFAFNIVGCGLPASAGRTAERLRWLGPRRYTLASIYEVLRGAVVEADIAWPGVERSGIFSLLLACNTRHTGTGMCMAPGAKLDDGRFDLLLLGEASRARILGLLAKVYDGSHIASPLLECQAVSGLSIELRRAGPINVDGECLRGRRLELRVVPGALSVFVCGSQRTSTTHGEE